MDNLTHVDFLETKNAGIKYRRFFINQDKIKVLKIYYLELLILSTSF